MKQLTGIVNANIIKEKLKKRDDIMRRNAKLAAVEITQEFLQLAETGNTKMHYWTEDNINNDVLKDILINNGYIIEVSETTGAWTIKVRNDASDSEINV